MRKVFLLNNLEQTLADRAKTHGDFSSHAAISQQMKQILVVYGYDKFTPEQRESLEMICHKIARILNGNPNTHDHWHDIAGYATLVAKELEKNETR